MMSDKVVSVELAPAEWNVVIMALAELPYKQVYEIVPKVRAQVIAAVSEDK